jgi:hypothetical protein
MTNAPISCCEQRACPPGDDLSGQPVVWSSEDRRRRVLWMIARKPTVTSRAPNVRGIVGSLPVGGRVSGMVGATVDPPAPGSGGAAVIGGAVVTAATAVGSLVIVTVTDWFAAMLNTGGDVLGPPPSTLSDTDQPGGSGAMSSPTAHRASAATVNSGAPLAPDPGSVTSASVPSSHDT